MYHPSMKAKMQELEAAKLRLLEDLAENPEPPALRLHPSLLDRAALVAGWREGLLAQAVLAGRTRGYRSHPQLERFRETADPVVAVATYLWALHSEASRRGYRFDAQRLDAEADVDLRLGVTTGQLDYELTHLREDEAHLGTQEETTPTREKRTVFLDTSQITFRQERQSEDI